MSLLLLLCGSDSVLWQQHLSLTDVLTGSANLALALANTSPLGRQPRVGLLDLDIFGPSVPMLFGLEKAGEPELSECKWLPYILTSLYSLQLTNLSPCLTTASRPCRLGTFCVRS